MTSSTPDSRLEGRVALVTGSSRGIGRAIAMAMAMAGADVAVHYYGDQTGTAEDVAGRIRGLGKRAIVVGGDVSSREAVGAIARRTQEELGPIDILVNNAATRLGDAPFWEIDEESWDRLFAVNVKGQLFTAQAVAPSMRARRTGVILNISSLGAGLALPGYAAYISSKGAVEALTRAMAVELAPCNIRVNALAPGHIGTPPNVKDIMEDPERAESYLGRIALGRLGRMDEMASTAVFLVSDESGYITGQVIQAEGGVNMWQGPIR